MKVLWLGHNLAFPPKGGALQRNYNLLREVAKKAEVHFLAFDQPMTRPPEVEPEQCLAALGRFCASVDWVPLPSSSLWNSRHALAVRAMLSSEPYDFAWLRSSQMSQKIDALVKRVGPDVVHVDALGLSQYLPLLGKVGSLLNHHDVESSKIELRSAKAQNPLMRVYFSQEARRLRKAEHDWCPRFGVNAVVSEEEGKVLSRVAPDAVIRSVPNGVDTEYFTPRDDPGGQTLLFCGSMDMHPNQEAMEYFIHKVWPYIRRKMPSARLQIVGRKPPDWLKEIGQSEATIEVTGFVEDVRPYFRTATVCVCPILSGGGTRLKILDSLAMGVPVIATHFAATGLSLEHDRHLIYGDTPEEFASHALRLLTDGGLRKRIASSGAEQVERLYSWPVVGRALLDSYALAAQQRPH